jgi:hypothetical protein
MNSIKHFLVCRAPMTPNVQPTFVATTSALPVAMILTVRIKTFASFRESCIPLSTIEPVSMEDPYQQKQFVGEMQCVNPIYAKVVVRLNGILWKEIVSQTSLKMASLSKFSLQCAYDLKHNSLIAKIFAFTLGL